ncbi:MAG: FCD domain-containing protein [Polyangiaceae bacterium]
MSTAVKKENIFGLSIEERAPLSVAVSRRIREAIVSGKVSVGTELPSEKELAKELGVGRSTVREALRILQAQGLLSGGDTVSTARPKVTAEQTVHIAAHTMENALRLGQVPLKDLLELRLLIESTAFRQAAERQDAASITEAKQALEVMKADKVDIETFRAADLSFHRALVAGSGNIAFTMVMGVLRSAISGHLGEALQEERHPRATMAKLAAEHEAILVAVEHGHHRRAADLVTEHIEGFYKGKIS